MEVHITINNGLMIGSIPQINVDTAEEGRKYVQLQVCDTFDTASLPLDAKELDGLIKVLQIAQKKLNEEPLCEYCFNTGFTRISSIDGSFTKQKPCNCKIDKD